MPPTTCSLHSCSAAVLETTCAVLAMLLPASATLHASGSSCWQAFLERTAARNAHQKLLEGEVIPADCTHQRKPPQCALPGGRVVHPRLGTSS
jgi:hypothetical protein